MGTSSGLHTSCRTTPASITLTSDHGDLVSFLRGIGVQPFVDPRSDVAERSPLDWVSRLYNSHPDWRDPIDDAYAVLLTAEDPLPYRVLEQVSKRHERSFLPRLYGVIARPRRKLTMTKLPTLAVTLAEQDTRLAEVLRLSLAEGLSISAITKRLHMSRKTVRRMLACGTARTPAPSTPARRCWTPTCPRSGGSINCHVIEASQPTP